MEILKIGIVLGKVWHGLGKTFRKMLTPSCSMLHCLGQVNLFSAFDCSSHILAVSKISGIKPIGPPSSEAIKFLENASLIHSVNRDIFETLRF